MSMQMQPVLSMKYGAWRAKASVKWGWRLCDCDIAPHTSKLSSGALKPSGPTYRLLGPASDSRVNFQRHYDFKDARGHLIRLIIVVLISPEESVGANRLGIGELLHAYRIIFPFS